MTTIAGLDPIGWDQGGDGEPFTGARFNWLRGVVLGADGNLFIADSGNERVRVVRGPLRQLNIF
jgi:hypothetical protein